MTFNTDTFILKEAQFTESIKDNEFFKSAVILVEALYYLQNLLDSPPSTEPLLTALGGLPLALKHYIEADLDQWKANNITPVFVFDGQSVVGKEDVALGQAKEGAILNNNAWELYTSNHANAAVGAFGSSGAIKAKQFVRLFQNILFNKGVEFMSAPHSACAQIAYMNRVNQDFSGMLGSLELLLHDIGSEQVCVITSIDFEKQVARGVVKPDLLKQLHASEDQFIDVALMAGTSFLSPFPMLKDHAIIANQPYSVKDAMTMYRTTGGTIRTLCENFSDLLQKQDPMWEDRYRKARMALKHVVTVLVDGKLEVRDFNGLTVDNHMYIGLQLPAELYHYLVHGAISPRTLNWLVSLEILVPPPLDGGASREYRQLMSEKLVPVHEKIIALYTSRMHRVFLHKFVTMRFWFDDEKTVKLNHQSVQPHPHGQVKGWKVKSAAFNDHMTEASSAPGSFSFAINLLKNDDYAKSTIVSPKTKPIRSTDEVLANTMWRFLHLRGYIDDDHRLTIWGKALGSALEALGPARHLEEATFLAIELLQYDELNARHLHEEWIGAPIRGTEADKKHCLLIARCACLLKLRHKEIGYTGPLSRNLLAWHSIVSAVRQSDRDLAECVLACMFLYNHADRVQRKDWHQIGSSLPFKDDVDIGLGIAVKTYLDDHASPDTSPEEKVAAKQKYAQELIPHGIDFAQDLDTAFMFFDAIYSGVKALGDLVSDRAVWDGANEYLAARR